MNRVMALATLMVVLAALRLGQAVDCGQVDSTMGPCLSYLKDGGASPPGPCCDAVRNLVSKTPSQQDRQTACECLKGAASRFNIKADVAADLPGGCGVSTSVPISPDVNCQNIS